MDKWFAAANTDSDVIRLFRLSSQLGDNVQVRCAHSAGIGVALGLCKVDPDIFLAAREAARASDADYRLVLETCLPMTAHTILGGRLLLLSAEEGGFKVRRRYNSRDMLIERLIKAATPGQSIWSQVYTNRITSGYEQLGKPTPVGSCSSVAPTVSLASAQVIIASERP